MNGYINPQTQITVTKQILPDTLSFTLKSYYNITLSGIYLLYKFSFRSFLADKTNT